MEANTHEKKRKTRSDAGAIMATRRDQYCLAWIAEQYAARGDQIRRLLSRFPDPQRPFKEELIAQTTVRDQIARWRRAGWIEYRRVLADQPGFAWVSRRGLQLVDLDDIYTARVPASVRLDHIYAINQVRLWMDERFTWKSERRYRCEQDARKGKDIGPLPDGIVTTRQGRIAVEVEISAKKPKEVEAKLARLLRRYEFDLDGKRCFPFARVAFFVPNENIKDLVESACEKLQEDERFRVTIDVREDLIASRFRSSRLG